MTILKNARVAGGGDEQEETEETEKELQSRRLQHGAWGGKQETSWKRYLRRL